MADIRAFRGFRYDLGKIGALSSVIAPPYDVIDSTLQQKLYDESAYNSIRLELTKDEPGDNELKNKYTRAGQTLRDWLDEGVLRQDTARCLYVYEQEYTVEGKSHIRRGFLARVRLEPFGQGKIYPHEQTLSGPKADRLKLYQSTNFNISPVFGLYPDQEGEVFARIDRLIVNQPPIEAKDHLGVINRMWVINDQATVSAVIGMMGSKPVYIADGHHRYETGCKYAEELRSQGELTDPEAAGNFTLMMLVGMSDPGLLILPTHRLVSGLSALTSEQLKAILLPHFNILSTYDNPQECWEDIELDGSQSILGFGTVADGQWTVARLRDTAIMDQLAPDQSKDWRGLGVSILHRLVLDHLLKGRYASGSEHNSLIAQQGKCKYVHLLQEVIDDVKSNTIQLACLVPPAQMSHVEQIAGNGEKMPPKSTYFYPKIVTGMVLHSLKKE